MQDSPTIEDFKKIEIRVGTITVAEKVEKSDKLLKLTVDFGPHGTRTILTGMQKWYQPQEMQGLQTVFILNLPYRKMMGLESQGMILGIGDNPEKKPVFLKPVQSVENGELLI